MTLTKPAPATYADIEALPANMVGQILYGALHAHPRPTPRHTVASNSIGDEVTGPFQKNVAVQADGCSWSSPNSTLATMSSFPTFQAGNLSG
ncbi:MAG: hypothetical protein AAFV45_08935 [Pseudomonadota bacterium]